MIYTKPDRLTTPDISRSARLFREVIIEGLAAMVPVNSLNEVINPANSKRFRVPTTVLKGDPIVLGGDPVNPVLGLAGVAQTSYDARDGMCTIMFDGAHNLSVTSQFGSPVVSIAIKPGDPIYAAIYEAGAVYDSTTNCWTGFKLDGNKGGILFGSYFDTANLVSGATATALVRLKLAA